MRAALRAGPGATTGARGGTVGEQNQSGVGRYGGVAVALHWIVALGVFAQFALGWWMIGLPNTPPGYQAYWYNVHKSIGITLGLFVVLRVAWRLTHPAPELPGSVALWQRRAARTSHFLLYACMLVMPISGFLGSSFTKYPIKYWGMTLPRLLDPSPALKDLCSNVHYVTVCLFMLLVAIHMAAALKHLLAGDGVFRRMLPARAVPGVEKT